MVSEIGRREQKNEEIGVCQMIQQLRKLLNCWFVSGAKRKRTTKTVNTGNLGVGLGLHIKKGSKRA